MRFLCRSATRELNAEKPGRFVVLWSAVSWMLGTLDVLYVMSRTLPNDVAWAVMTAVSGILTRTWWPFRPSHAPVASTAGADCRSPRNDCNGTVPRRRHYPGSGHHHTARRVGVVERRGTYYDAGWGDIDRTAAFVDAALQVFDDDEPLYEECSDPALQLARTMKRRVIETTGFDMEPWPAPPSAERIVRGKGVSLHHGTFLSPEADVLCPAGCADWEQKRCLRDAHFVLMWPDECRPLDCFRGVGEATKGVGVKGVLILLPATGEQLHDLRISLGVEFALRHGFATVSLTSPYYGHRAPAGQQKHFVSDVAAMLMQCHANPVEAATIGLAVLRATQKETSSVPLVLSGFSFGGAMSVCASAYMCGFAPPKDRAAMLKRVVAVPYVGPSSLAVCVEGMVRHDLNWQRIFSSTFDDAADCGPQMVRDWLAERMAEGEAKHHHSHKARRELAEGALRHVLRTLDTARLVKRVTELNRNAIGAVHCVVAINDFIVPPCLGDELYRSASQLVAPNGHVSSSRIAGGHVTAFVAKQETLLAVIPEVLAATKFDGVAIKIAANTMAPVTG
jgi:hypothetical protein